MQWENKIMFPLTRIFIHLYGDTYGVYIGKIMTFCDFDFLGIVITEGSAFKAADST